MDFGTAGIPDSSFAFERQSASGSEHHAAGLSLPDPDSDAALIREAKTILRGYLRQIPATAGYERYGAVGPGRVRKPGHARSLVETARGAG